MLTLGAGVSPSGAQSRTSPPEAPSTANPELDAQIDQALTGLNQDLDAKAFGVSSRVTFQRLAGCRVRHLNTWSDETARSKGHSQAVTVNEIDLRDNVRSVEFVPTHDDYVKDHVEHWTDHIRIAFIRPVRAQLIATEIGASEPTTAGFDSGFATIDALHANTYQVKAVLDEIEALVALCRASPGVDTAERP